MHERRGNMWMPKRKVDAFVVPTNGSIRTDGALVMGAGVAKQAKELIPGLDKVLGELVHTHGNGVYFIPILQNMMGDYLISFPTKRVWHEPASLELIEQSIRQLIEVTNALALERVVLPRVGTGHGRLDWSDVRAILRQYLDDRFWVVTPK